MHGTRPRPLTARKPPVCCDERERVEGSRVTVDQLVFTPSEYPSHLQLSDQDRYTGCSCSTTFPLCGPLGRLARSASRRACASNSLASFSFLILASLHSVNS